MKTIKIATILLIMTGHVQLFGQQTHEESYKTVGFELDILPYLTGGYYASVWYGSENFRIRPVIAKVKTPSFMVEDGFEDNMTRAYALIIDYFPADRFRSFWIGGGVEYWDNTIGHEDIELKTDYSNTVLTLGGGYVWKFYKEFYLNPWIALHYAAFGDKKVNVGEYEYQPATLIPEVSLKLGWNF